MALTMGLLVLAGGYWISRALPPSTARDRRWGAFYALVMPAALVWCASQIGVGQALGWAALTALWAGLAWAVLPRPVAEPPPLPSQRPQLSMENAVRQQAMARPEPEPESRIPRSTARPAPPSPPRPLRRQVRSNAHVQLHCRQCGSALTRAMVEKDPSGMIGGGSFRYGDVIRPGSERRPTEVDILPGNTDDALFFEQGQLAEAALPLKWNTSSEGCCGPEARYGANVLCHGCGTWALFFNETCYSPRFFAARPSEVEVRQLDRVEALRPVDAREHSKEHWAKVALKLPGVFSWRSFVEELAAETESLVAAAGLDFEVDKPRSTDVARLDRAATLVAAKDLLEHALAVTRGGIKLSGHVGGSEARVVLLCHPPLAPEAFEGISSVALRSARRLGGSLATWEFSDGDLQLTLSIPVQPIPLKPVAS